jgi:hypothetical protein
MNFFSKRSGEYQRPPRKKWTRVATITAGYLIFMSFSLRDRVEKLEDPVRELPNGYTGLFEHYSIMKSAASRKLRNSLEFLTREAGDSVKPG